MSNLLIDEIKLYHKQLDARVVKYHDIINGEMLMDLNDGTQLIYDMYFKMCRRPIDPDNMTEEEFKKEFGMKLNIMMRRRCMGQVEMSEVTGIAQSQISRYTSGITAPSFYNIHKIAKALNCSFEELIYG